VQWPTALLILTLPLQASVSLSFRLELDEDNGSLYRVEFDRQGGKGSLFAACVQRELYSRFLEGVSQDLRRFLPLMKLWNARASGLSESAPLAEPSATNTHHLVIGAAGRGTASRCLWLPILNLRLPHKLFNLRVHEVS
jgi:hypothetical protein